MLSQLYFKNIAVISEATVELEPGFNIFTGETGAGKTLLITAINGVLGARLSKDIIRSGEERAYISASFTDIEPSIAQAIGELGYDVADRSLLISREIGVKNICKINGRPATTQLLKDISSMLIDVHGQKDNHRLLLPDNHIDYIDEFGELEPLLQSYQEKYRQIMEIKRQLDQVNKNDREKEHKVDLLNYQINEIESAQLEPGEEETLLLRREQIQNAEHIVQLIGRSKMLLDGEDEIEGAASLIHQLSSNLNELAKFIPELEETAARVEEISYEIGDCSSEIGNYLDNIEYEADELEILEDRLDMIYKLKRKYGNDIDEILLYLEDCRKQLDEIEFSEEKVQNLQKQYHQHMPVLQAAADELTSARHKAAREFLSRVKKELEFLNMPSVRLSISVSKTGLKPNGQDEMEFLISSNIGEEPKALAKIASGGELSRVMLSIKNVLAEKDHVGTAIFDEIDTGVSGKAAQKIGMKLKEVSKNRQVICVTHLAPVAAFADNHLYICKQEMDGRTFTVISQLTPQERVNEVARIISGDNITDTAMKNAEEMIQLAILANDELSSKRE